MLILVDKKIPEKAKLSLQSFGEVVLFETEDITYKAISGHPDVFICKCPEKLIIAPNTPNIYIDILIKNNIKFTNGNKHIGLKFPGSVYYNALVTDKYIIHNEKYTDETIISENSGKVFINVKQAYTRCNTVEINSIFFTSDKSVYEILKEKREKVIYVNPEKIVLEDFKNGFFGGCCGVFDYKLFVCGKLDNLDNFEKNQIYDTGIEIIELYDGPLYDIGSILFLK